MSKEIVIVGAGIIGLSIAYELVTESADSFDKITIISKEFPNTDFTSVSYTSTKAGAHYRPFPSVTGSDLRESLYTRVTLEKYKKLSLENPNCSVKFIQGEEFFTEPSELLLTIPESYKRGLENFQIITADKLPQDVKFGTKYDTWSVNPPIFLKFLYEFLQKNDKVEFVTRELKALKEVYQLRPNLFKIINCTGLGLQYEGGGYDANCFKIRGQTLLIKPSKQTQAYENKTVTYQLKDNIWCFVIPRPLNGGIILGGTKTLKNEVEPIELETLQLYENGAKYFPDLINNKSFDQFMKEDVIKVNVGFRPARKNGSLIGIDSNYKDVINAYGVGGMGFEVSFGVAKEVVKLIQRRNSKL